MVRKSKLIGKSINDLKVIDSKHIGKDTWLIVECQNCKSRFFIGRRVFLHGINGCEKCNKLHRKQRNTKGYVGTKLHRIYMSILRRTRYHQNEHCHNKNYVERNIKMCKEWSDDFQAFYKWSMENGFKEGLTIDRIDNNKGYEPSNCRWVTIKEQANNRRNNVLIEYNGTTKTLAEWAEYCNLPKHIIYNRYRAGWNFNDIVNKPIDINRRKKNEPRLKIKN